jgi:hypothetical protein
MIDDLYNYFTSYKQLVRPCSFLNIEKCEELNKMANLRSSRACPKRLDPIALYSDTAQRTTI